MDVQGKEMLLFLLRHELFCSSEQKACFRRALYPYAKFGQNRGNSMEIYEEQTGTHTLLYTYEVYRKVPGLLLL
jgi:hypothetical protein